MLRYIPIKNLDGLLTPCDALVTPSGQEPWLGSSSAV